MKISALLWAGLIITLILVWRVSINESSQQTVLPTKVLAKISVEKSQVQQAQQFNESPDKLYKRESYESVTNLFSLAEVKEDPIDSRRVQAKVQPIILPPLPFKYAGRWKDQTQLMVLLSMNDEIVPVKVGDIVFNQYQLLNIAENAQGLSLEFLNQPFHKTQVLQVGKAQDE